ncbi:MAG: tRNA pseudouridine(55) synthase TruB [Nitrospirales bacterium]|nr:tRNA pseudouridine(55) synthase TruB [Nitrospirales bacterium]
MNIVINLNKGFGISSQDAVTQVKRAFKVKKAGHAGTLDPIATGVLLVCLNEATKVTSCLSDLDKEYVLTAKLGESTDTYDTEGKVTKTVTDFHVTQEDIERVLQSYIGDIEQVPPMYSAIKMDGQPLYKLARKGIEVERKPRKVTIHAIEILSFESPFVRLKVSCTKGTYVRSLCHDMGEALGTGAHITELIRTRIGGFRIEDSATIDELPAKTSSAASLDDALRHLPGITLHGNDLRKALNGNSIAVFLKEPIAGPAIVKLKDPAEKLIGIGNIFKGIVKVERLFNL